MKMDCFLHIGTEKTATTSIQEWIFANRNSLVERGIYTSNKFGSGNHRKIVNYFRSEFDDYQQWFRIRTERQNRKHFSGFEREFKAEFEKARSSGCHRFLITSEHFHSRLVKKEEIERLHEFLSGIFEKVYVISYFREQTGLCRSAYSTYAENGGTLAFKDYIQTVSPENDYFNHLNISDKWSRIFGKEYFDANLFEKRYFRNGSILIDFAEKIGLSPNDGCIGFPGIHSNKSSYAWQLPAYRAIHDHVAFFTDNGNGFNDRNRELTDFVKSIEVLRNGNLNHGTSDIFELFCESNEEFFRKYTPGKSFSKPESESVDELYPVIEELIYKIFASFLVEFDISPKERRGEVLMSALKGLLR